MGHEPLSCFTSCLTSLVTSFLASSRAPSMVISLVASSFVVLTSDAVRAAISYFTSSFALLIIFVSSRFSSYLPDLLGNPCSCCCLLCQWVASWLHLSLQVVVTFEATLAIAAKTSFATFHPFHLVLDGICRDDRS